MYCDSINRTILLKVFEGILDLLFATEHFPVLEIHIFVEFSAGFPCDTWT